VPLYAKSSTAPTNTSPNVPQKTPLPTDLFLDFPDSAAHQSILHFWGGVEARLFKNLENARNVLNDLVKNSHFYDHWIQYINIERF
jgi:hypothetical protein